MMSAVRELWRSSDLLDPRTLGQTAPNAKGRTYWHGTHTAYQYGPCRCQRCKDALAAYRAVRRAAGKDAPRRRRQVATDVDRHISNDWFRNQVWNRAVERASPDFRITPHGMRHTHASWLLAGGADLQVVRERLGHGSIAATGRYLHTLPNLPNAGEAALAALDKVRGSRETPTVNEQTPAPAAPVGRAGDPGRDARHARPTQEHVRIPGGRAMTPAQPRDMGMAAFGPHPTMA